MQMSTADRQFLSVLDRLGDPLPSLETLDDLAKRFRMRAMVGDIMEVLNRHDLAGAAINQDGEGGLYLSVAKTPEEDVASAWRLDSSVDGDVIESLNDWDATHTGFLDKIEANWLAPFLDQLITRDQREHWERLAFGSAVAEHLEARAQARDRNNSAQEATPARASRSSRPRA